MLPIAGGWRWAGTLVGSSSMCGANLRNFSSCNRDRASAKILRAPAICTACTRVLDCKVVNTSVRIKGIMPGSFDVFLLMTCTRSWLSVCILSFLFCSCSPHTVKAKTIGYNSNIVMLYFFHSGGNSPAIHLLPNIAPYPMVLHASVYRCKSGLVVHPTCWNMHAPLNSFKKFNHIFRSALSSCLILTKWYLLCMLHVLSINLRKNALPGVTTWQAKLRRPMIDCNCFKRTLLIVLGRSRRISCLHLFSLSSGNLAIILLVSNSIPKKVRTWAGPSVFSGANGMPISAHNCLNLCKAALHPSWLALMNKKSSNTWTIICMFNLVLQIHCNTVENDSNILHDVLHPIARHLSK